MIQKNGNFGINIWESLWTTVEYECAEQKFFKNAILGCAKETMTDKSVEIIYHEDSFTKAL